MISYTRLQNSLENPVQDRAQDESTYTNFAHTILSKSRKNPNFVTWESVLWEIVPSYAQSVCQTTGCTIYSMVVSNGSPKRWDR